MSIPIQIEKVIRLPFAAFSMTGVNCPSRARSKGLYERRQTNEAVFINRMVSVLLVFLRNPKTTPSVSFTDSSLYIREPLLLRNICANTGRRMHILTERNFGKYDGLSLL
jgi:hypothetical protein